MPATAERSERKGGNILKTIAVVPRCSAPLSCAPPAVLEVGISPHLLQDRRFCAPQRAFPSPIQWEDADPCSYRSGHKGASLRSPPCSPSSQIRGQKRPWGWPQLQHLDAILCCTASTSSPRGGWILPSSFTPLSHSGSHVQDEPDPTPLAQGDPLGSDE